MLNWLKLFKKPNLHLYSFSECAVTITQPLGVITSPGFPHPYRNRINCTWNIQLSRGQFIQFNFLHFDVAYDNNCGWDASASDIFSCLMSCYFYHNLLISVMIHWLFMMGVQIHHPCWKIHIVVIPYHPAESLQATNSSFIFNLMLQPLELVLN